MYIRCVLDEALTQEVEVMCTCDVLDEALTRKVDFRCTCSVLDSTKTHQVVEFVCVHLTS